MSLDINCDDIPSYIKDAIRSSGDREATIIKMGEANARRKEILDLKVKAHRKAEGIIQSHPEGPMAGLDAMITNDSWAKAKNGNVEYTQKAVQSYVESFIPTLKQELSTGYLGLVIPKKQKALRRSFVKALIDGDIESPLVGKMAQEAKKVTDFLREKYNKMGGEIGTLRTEKGYLPQSHDAVAIRNVSKEEWVKFTYPLLDDVNRADVDRGALDLNYVYDTISTGGLSKGGRSGGGQGKSTINKHQEERVLDFKDGDTWLTYQERFGAKDPLATLDDHIRQMSTDIALMDVFGPNPDAMFKTLLDSVELQRTLSGEKKPKKGFDLSKKMYNVVSGRVDMDKGEFLPSGVMQSIRGLNTATLLNNAAVSTVTDPLLASFTAGTSGLNPLSTLGGYFKNIVRSGAKRTFEEEQLMGLGADVFSSEVTRRFSELGAGFWSKASEAVMRGTMMNILTESARLSFKSQLFKKELGKRTIAELTPDEHINILKKVHEESEYGVIMGDTRARAFTTMGESKGTAVGEIARSSTQFLTFPMSFVVKQGSRLFRHERTTASRIGMTAALTTLMTMGGALAMMGKDASKGYGVRGGFDPFSEDNDMGDIRKFWAAAALQGMGVGIIGDFMFSDVNRFGGGSGVTVGGPSFGLLEDTIKLTKGNINQAALGEDTNFGSELVDYTNRHLNPVKAWYTQAVWEDLVLRNIKITLDPNYEKAERRKERKRKREYGQEKQEWLQDSRDEVTESVGAYNAQDSLQDIIDKI